MKTSSIEVIGETFQEIADIVTPTMGAKGRLAVINNEMGRPLLTDDGVTVARECMRMEGFKRMVALSMVEAASSTEKAAFDGTTLTVLLTNEFYKLGRKWVSKGMHPQQAADKLSSRVNALRCDLKKLAFPLSKRHVKDLAYITTKIPFVGEMVSKAYKSAGADMRVIVEHERTSSEHSISYTEGMILNHGYLSGEMQRLCNLNDAFVYNNAHIALLSEGIISQVGIKNFFDSIPVENIQDPFVFVMGRGFNPESIKMLLDTLVANHFKFQFLMLTETNTDELFLDIAARTNGQVQSASLGTSEYLFSYCGLANVDIGINKSTLVAVGDPTQIEQRIRMYKKELEDTKFVANMVRYDSIIRRLGNLEKGITKIMVAVPTSTEFQTLKLKLDDAIGAVKCASVNGLLIGGGKTLYWLGYTDEHKELRPALITPLSVIISNAGLVIRDKKPFLESIDIGYDVQAMELVSLKEQGIVDSFDSIDTAVKNAVSIASNYLRTYILLK